MRNGQEGSRPNIKRKTYPEEATEVAPLCEMLMKRKKRKVNNLIENEAGRPVEKLGLETNQGTGPWKVEEKKKSNPGKGRGRRP